MWNLINITLLCFVFISNIELTYCRQRTYFLAAQEIVWNYVPTGRNEVFPEKPIGLSSFWSGTEFIKVVYRAYSDETFTTPLEHPEWLGYLGPVIYAEVGETIIIHFKNNATKPVSLHPHGVFYDKDSEGALYNDGTKGKDKLDDDIHPNGEHTYTWIATERAGPAVDDTACIPWMYHSHISSPFGTNSGLVGAMIICREGILDANGKRNDVDKDFVLMFTVTDENLSYYLDENIEKFATKPDVDKDDEDFQGSLQMDGINGYQYGNLPGFEMDQGNTVEWHILGMGTESDIHTAYFHGNVLDVRNHRTDSISVEPAAFFTGRMKATNPGRWLITDAVTTHYEDGSLAFYTVNEIAGKEPTPTTGTVREYFIAAVEIAWDYLPVGHDPLTGEDTLLPFFSNAPDRLGSVYNKVVYREFTDGTFTEEKNRTKDEMYLGYLGPVIRAEVGDIINVTFRNLAAGRYSIHAQGVLYDKKNEGMKYNDGTSESYDDGVGQGETYTYHWTVPESYGPLEADDDCLTWMYYSAVDVQTDLYSGLVGPLVTCKQGTLASKTQKFLFFFVADENLSSYLNTNLVERQLNSSIVDDEDFQASNRMSSINGFSFSNLPEISVCQDDDVSWHLMSLGKEIDQTTVYFHGNTFIFDGARTDSVPIFPGIYQTVTMTPHISGKWIIESQSAVQKDSGMVASFVVENCNGSPTRSYQDECDGARTYYIAAVEMDWDFAEEKYDHVRDMSLDDPESEGHIFVTQTDTLIGSVYKKALYRQYEDAEFKIQSSHESYLGTLGPIIRMEVDKKICVVFKNMASRNYSISGHGIVVASHEMEYVAPGETYTYIWEAPTNVAPTDNDPNCVAYAYYSTADRVRDTYSGLIGPLVLCKKGVLDDRSQRKDVDREFALLFMVMDENQSWYLKENIDKFAKKPSMVDTSNPEFEESNLMHGINGFIYTNLKGLEMKKGENIDWYLIAMGTDVDLHSVHFHGQTLTYQTDTTHRADVFELFPGVYKTIEMKPDNIGTWLLHCHINDHIFAGMETFFSVTDAPVPSGSEVIAGSTIAFIIPILLALIKP